MPYRYSDDMRVLFMRRSPVIVSVFILSLNLSLPVFAAPVYHEIRKGETLYSLARSYKVPYEAIAAANGITDPSKVRIGDSLIIPDLYTVESGDTLIGIARRYGTTAQLIRDANRLTSAAVIKPGDLLVIPGTATLGAVPSGQATPVTASASTTTSTTSTTVPQSPGRVSSPSSSTTTTTKTLSTQGSSTTTTIRPVQTTTTSTSTSTTSTGSSTTSSRQPSAPGSGASIGTATTLASPSATTTSSLASVTQSRPSTPPPTLPQDIPVMRTGTRQVDRTLTWPAQGEALYLDGRLEGVMIRTFPGESAKSVATGLVVSAGPARGFGLAVFVQSPAGHIYVYGGNERLSVEVGSRVRPGDEIGRIGIDAKDGRPVAFFFVFKDGESVDPARAPRD